MKYISSAPSVFPSPAPVAECFSPAPALPAEITVPCVEQDTEEEEENDQPVDYYSGIGVFLEKVDEGWPSRVVGTVVLLRDSADAKFFQFCQTERLLADDVIHRIGQTGLVLRPARGGRTCGRTPISPVGQATTAMRCGSRRRSWLAGFTRSGWAKGPCSAAPHDVSSILYSMVVLVHLVLELLRFPGEHCG